MERIERDVVPDHSSYLERTFIEHRERVLRAAYRVTGSLSDAEDVLQLVFLRLAKREYEPAEILNPGSYLHRAAINAALDLLRARKESQNMAYEDAELLHPLEVASRGGEDFDSVELRQWLRTAMARLSGRPAEMFVLRYIEGFDNREIAKMLGASRATVAVTLHRTRNQLQKDFTAHKKGKRQ